MSVMQMSLEEIRVAGLRAVSRDLGAVGLVRFLQQFETGHGDYSVERHEWLCTDTVHGVAERIRQMRAGQGGAANQQRLGEGAR
jgi:hypothetical protein